MYIYVYGFMTYRSPDFRCTADCGWITGHSYVTYGPLLNGASVVVYEGVMIVHFIFLFPLMFAICV